jgi:hypothetical protein
VPKTDSLEKDMAGKKEIFSFSMCWRRMLFWFSTSQPASQPVLFPGHSGSKRSIIIALPHKGSNRRREGILVLK